MDDFVRYLVAALGNPASHVLTFFLGMALVYRFGVIPERERNEEFQEKVDELWSLQKQALERVGRRELPTG